MQYKSIIQVLGNFLIFLSIWFLFPIGLSYMDNGADFVPLVRAMSLTLGCGFMMSALTWKVKLNLSVKDGFAIVTMTWVIMSAFSALPFCFSQDPRHWLSFTDAYFEMVSGYTTTGVSAINDVEALPRGLQLWRCLTHWIGGMGVIVLFLAIRPTKGNNGGQLFRAEVSGPVKDKISPKVANTAKTLWAIYFGLSALCFLTYQLLGMNWFDAACHAMSTIASGGFSNYNKSMAYFDSWKIDAAATLFMFLTGCNFMMYLYILKGKWRVPFHNVELRFFIFIILTSVALMTVVLMNSVAGESMSFLRALRYTSFQIVSAISCTGFATADYNAWPNVCHAILMMVMCTGACTGSTCGAIKVFRIYVAFKLGLREIGQILQPRAVLPMQVDGQDVSERLLRVVLGHVCLYFLFLGFFVIVLLISERSNYSITNIVFACISAMGNVGLGLGDFGPINNFGGLNEFSTWCCSLMMLLGRLELYCFLALFHRIMWNR